MKFVCKNCNYRFESKTNMQERNCPYCGQREVREEPTAQDLLEDID